MIKDCPRVTSKLSDYCSFGSMLTFICRPVRVMAPSLRGRAVPNEGTDGSPGIGEPGDRRDDVLEVSNRV